MNAFLYVMVEQIPLLLDSDLIDEILSIKGGVNLMDTTDSHRQWRSQLLTPVNLRALLQRPPAQPGIAAVGIVYRSRQKANPLLLIADQVIKLMFLSEDKFSLLPPEPKQAHQYFDAIYAVSDKTQAYRLRSCLSQQVLAN